MAAGIGASFIFPPAPLPADRNRPVAASGAGFEGRIKEREEDFLVEELPGVEPCGGGEHLYLFVEKRGVTTPDMAGAIARHFGVRRSAVGFAGLKDRVAVARQLVSVHLPGVEARAPESLMGGRVRPLWAARHTSKLRRGQCEGNRFVIRVRGAEPTAAVTAYRVLRELERHGVPNAFGAQRFGARMNNHLVGAAILRGDWRGAVEAMMSAGGAAGDDPIRTAIVKYEAGDLGGAIAELPTGASVERLALRTLEKGDSHERAIRSINERDIAFFISAVQSAAFNAYLMWRWREGLIDGAVEGDLLWSASERDARGVWSHVSADGGDVDSFRLTGPMWGPNMPRAAGRVDEAELDALGSVGLCLDDMAQMREVAGGALRGTRRPLKVRVTNTDAEGGVDEHGAYVRVAFDLPAGAYATTVLSMMMGESSRARIIEDEEVVEDA